MPLNSSQLKRETLRMPWKNAHWLSSHIVISSHRSTTMRAKQKSRRNDAHREQRGELKPRMCLTARAKMKATLRRRDQNLARNNRSLRGVDPQYTFALCRLKFTKAARQEQADVPSLPTWRAIPSSPLSFPSYLTPCSGGRLLPHSRAGGVRRVPAAPFAARRLLHRTLFMFFRFFPVQAHSCLCSAMSRVPRIYRRCATVWDQEIRQLPSAPDFSSPRPHVCLCVCLCEARVCCSSWRNGVWSTFSSLGVLVSYRSSLIFSFLLRVSCALFRACARDCVERKRPKQRKRASP